MHSSPTRHFPPANYAYDRKNPCYPRQENRCCRKSGAPVMLMLVPWEVTMERDDDYMREMLIGMTTSGEWLTQTTFHKTCTPDEQRHYFHMLMAADAGLVEDMGRGMFRLRDQGHGYVGAIRDEGAWRTLKGMVPTGAKYTLDFLVSVATGMARAQLGKIGVDLG